MKVWYRLEDLSATRIEVSEIAIVDDLRRSILAEDAPELLRGCSPAQLLVCAADGSPLQPDTAVPCSTTYAAALIVKIDSEVSKQPEPKKLKSKQPFDVSKLLSPLEVQPPTKSSKEPVFTCSEDWMFYVETEIYAQLERADDPNGMERVPPMAVVCCSRGGKTRALLEIARRIHAISRRPDADPVAVIFVSFNDFTELQPHEQDDPVNALCQRIAFAALDHVPSDSPKKNAHAFQAFLDKNYDIRDADIRVWIEDSRALLVIDELNNLQELTVRDSIKAHEFGHFIKSTFLQDEGRYLVFSSHVLTTLGLVGEFVDQSYGSTRHVVLKELPVVENLSTAMERLYKNLDGAREAIYYGLLPGLLYEQSRGKPLGGRRANAVRRYNERVAGRAEQVFNKMLRSLFSGDIDDIPQELHILLDGCTEAGSQKVRWVPFHLEHVLEHVAFDGVEPRLSKLALDMAKLIKSLRDADEASGKGWEALFVLLLVARCTNHCCDGYFLPEHWFASVSVKVEYNPYFNVTMPFNCCRTWEDLRRGISASESPTVSIFYPSHATFNVYDVIAIYSADNKIEDLYGYQLKEGKANPSKSSLPPSAFKKSFVVKGDPPAQTLDKKDWSTPCGDVIDKFFGESGKYWTPQHWKLLTDTCQSSH